MRRWSPSMRRCAPHQPRLQRRIGRMPFSVPPIPKPATASRRGAPPHRPGRGRQAPPRWYSFTPPQWHVFSPPLTPCPAALPAGRKWSHPSAFSTPSTSRGLNRIAGQDYCRHHIIRAAVARRNHRDQSRRRIARWDEPSPFMPSSGRWRRKAFPSRRRCRRCAHVNLDSLSGVGAGPVR